MTKLSWGDTGTKTYEAGVDRGVLYIGNNQGVPFNGLISVSESPSGGDPIPYYLDGFKYLNIASAEEFQATIEAFAAPPEFAVCDGTVAINNGLFATQQPRKQFGFTYRSLVGNDVDGLDHGYKIHLVYNALAGSAQKQYKTLSDSSTASTLSWDITTTPVVIPGIKPTAHLVVDSTKTNRIILGYLESVLYGTNGMNPRLPSPAEVVALFGWPVSDISTAMNLLGSNTETPTPIINKALNPEFEREEYLEQIRNYIPRPYTTSGVRIMAPVVSGWTESDVADATAPSGMGRVTRLTASGTTMSSTVLAKAVDANILSGLPTNAWYTYGFRVKHNHTAAITLRSRVTYLNASDGVVSSSNGASVSVPANTWTILTMGSTWPVNAVKARIELISGTTSTTVAAGTNFDLDTLACVSGLTSANAVHIVHGDVPDVYPDRYSWTGAVNNSPSIYERRLPVGLIGYYGLISRSNEWFESGAYSLKAIADSAKTGVDIGYVTANNVEVGKHYTVAVVVNVPSVAANPGQYETLARAIYGNNGAAMSKAPRAVGIYDLRLTFTATHQAINLMGDNVPTYFDDLLIVEVPSVNEPYTGPVFSGNMSSVVVKNQKVVPEWTGEANWSTTIIEYYPSLVSPGNPGDAYLINNELWVFVEAGYWENFGPIPTS